jgi:hypothetical protein
MCLDLFSHPFREGDCGVEDCSGEQQHELFAPIPAGPIDLADFVAQNAGELLQDRVAGLVAVGVIHTLETIEIAHHARERLLQPLRVLEHLDQSVLEVASVVETRQGIGLRHVPQTFVGLQ